ncbi:MBL fold metallo-hydrolase [Halospeciosus flavus]|uniref:MBL fold metallo-hydrolase n=1 Tax=Halospeciosus flavus TaxID=3032283 RepID=A0ABD5Z3T1_9EURY|nr:MBL fold metallo-hydrolase [Halospeciosus flavus]
MTVHYDGLTLDWLGYATARIEGPYGTVVYTDPGRYGVLDGYEPNDGDLVLITHDHHYDSDGVEKVAAPDATVVVYNGVDVANIDRDVVAPEDLDYDVERVAYGDSLSAWGVEVDVVPAYNREDGPRGDGNGDVPHPKGFGCGFRFTVGGRNVFWPGDSDVISEHEGLNVDVLLPSIAQSFTMDRHDAADLAEDLDPELVLPIHYDTFPDLEADEEAFAGDVATRGVPVVVENPEQ